MEKDSRSESKIQFRPLTEGLGLNHFADGLPYTSNQKMRRPVNVPFQYPQTKEVAPPVVKEKSFSTTQLPVVAGAIRRSLAFILDVTIGGGIFLGILWSALRFNGFQIQDLFERRSLSLFGEPILLLYVVINIGYFLIQEITWSRTVGKAVLGIKIQSPSGFSILARSICFVFSFIPLGIGLTWCFFDHRKRCWHDLVTNSEVVKS